MGSLSNLSFLYLHDNELSGSVPPEIGKMRNSSDLNLQHNKLSGSVPPEIGKMANLSSLDLQNNELSGIYSSRNWNDGQISHTTPFK